tara:strand:- start:9425 stop:9958 length:534 start_codon:yes stop_codon:yes gene_type:complete
MKESFKKITARKTALHELECGYESAKSMRSSCRMRSYVEHIQYECSDVIGIGQFYAYIFDWKIRGKGIENAIGRSYEWIHVGTENSYVAFRSPYNNQEYDKESRHYTDHFGIVVSNIDDVIDRIIALGMEYAVKENHRYRKRIYIKDPDGNEVEVIQYLSDIEEERNDYKIDKSKDD